MRKLRASNIGDPRRNVEWMLCELLDCNRASLYGHPGRVVPHDALVRFEEMIERRSRHEPLQYILGHTSFCGLRIEVSPAVLIPRPETEQLFERARLILKKSPSSRVLDICTGSGCIPIAINHFFPKSSVFACDISLEALEIARKNAFNHHAAVSFFQCDILDDGALDPVELPLDLIVSNPPYIPAGEFADLPAEIRLFEPELALNAGDDPLVFYRAIARKAALWLEPGGALIFETHSDYSGDVGNLLRDAKFADVTLEKDLAGLPRIVSAIRG